jgi:RND family efflux transporter MFP subunit
LGVIRQIVISAIILAIGLLALAGVSDDVRGWFLRNGIDPSPFAIASTPPADPAPRQARPAEVILATVVETRAATRLRTIGTGGALRSVTLVPQASGILARIGFRSGEPVTRGHVLAALDDEAELIAQARARLALEAAEANLARLTTLASRNAVTQVNLDEARRQGEQARLDLRTADLALERRLVRAPFDGVLGIPEVETGDYVGPGTAIGTLDDRSAIAIDLWAPERFAGLIAEGLSVRAETIARPGEVFEGRIAAIDSQVDRKSRTLRLRAVIDNPGDVLRPGMSFAVTLDFPGDIHAGVPALAVQWRAEGPYVWAVRDGKAALVPVEIVERQEGRVLVRGALAPGDKVVTEGVHTLRPGAGVTEAPAPRPAS